MIMQMPSAPITQEVRLHVWCSPVCGHALQEGARLKQADWEGDLGEVDALPEHVLAHMLQPCAAEGLASGPA